MLTACSKKCLSWCSVGNPSANVCNKKENKGGSYAEGGPHLAGGSGLRPSPTREHHQRPLWHGKRLFSEATPPTRLKKGDACNRKKKATHVIVFWIKAGPWCIFSRQQFALCCLHFIFFYFFFLRRWKINALWVEPDRNVTGSIGSRSAM